MYQHRAHSPYSLPLTSGSLTPPISRYSPGAGPGGLLPPHHPGLGFPQLPHHLPHVKPDFDRPPGLLHPDDKVCQILKKDWTHGCIYFMIEPDWIFPVIRDLIFLDYDSRDYIEGLSLNSFLLYDSLWYADSRHSSNKHYGGDISVASYGYYKFWNQIIWYSVWICIARFLCHMFTLFCCAVVWIRKGVSIKKETIHFI